MSLKKYLAFQIHEKERYLSKREVPHLPDVTKKRGTSQKERYLAFQIHEKERYLSKSEVPHLPDS
jgi:septation ring formation regulator EzrA